MKIRAVLALPVLVALLVVGCGDDGGVVSEPKTPTQSSSRADSGMHHIHGLGVTSDGALHIATHDGMWIARAGQTAVEPNGESRQDVMGFSVVGDRHFLGSGHPAPDDTDQPPNLGLLESRDSGRTWTNVSLLGDIDFHVLESAGRFVYGVDSSTGALFASSNGGHTWRPRRLPAAAFSLAIDPRAVRHVVISTEAGMFASPDAGASWSPLNDDIAGLLAWARPEALYLVDGDGGTHLSGDGGRTWKRTGDAGGQPAAFIAHEDELYLALTDNLVERSADGGRTWRVRATPDATVGSE